jgi:hypothetical protein
VLRKQRKAITSWFTVIKDNTEARKENSETTDRFAEMIRKSLTEEGQGKILAK